MAKRNGGWRWQRISVFSPIRLGDESLNQIGFFQYRLVPNEDRYEVQHAFPEEEWAVNHHFSPKGVDFSVFDYMHEMHYTQPGWGPFDWSSSESILGRGAILKDHEQRRQTEWKNSLNPIRYIHG